MKNKLYIAFLLLFSCFIVACEDDGPEAFEGPYRLTLGGPDVVEPESTHEYTIGDILNPESYQWTVEGPAEIVGSTTGSTVTVQFNSLGDVMLKVTNNRDSREYPILVTPELDEDDEVVFSMTSAVNDPRVLRSGESDTLFLTFNQSLARNPTVSLITADTAFMSGSLGTVGKLSGKEYFVIYTAGEGNGTPTVYVSDIEANAAFGGATMDNQVVETYRVDNVAPVADLMYSQESASQGTEVTGTVTFNEPVTFTNSADSALYIMYSGAGVTADRDSLMPTDDPRVYTFAYTVTGEGNGMLTVELDNVSDMAGNMLGAVNNGSGLRIDNLAPAITGTARDNDQTATVTITSTEAGTGMYLVRTEGQAAPADASEFMTMTGAARGSINLTAGLPASTEVAIENGRYTVYYMARDAAGNYSAIESSALTMN